MVVLLVFVPVEPSWRFRVSAATMAAISDSASRRFILAVANSVGSSFIARSMHKAKHRHFAYNQTMDVEQHHDLSVSEIAAAIAEPARVRMLYCLMDGHARTSTELAAVAEVSPSTASMHLARLKKRHLVKVLAQGKYRYYSLAGRSVATALEALQVAAGGSGSKFVPTTPTRLRAARTCYDHMAGAVAVSLHDRLLQRGWLKARARDEKTYDLTTAGTKALVALGVQVKETLALRRRFAFACLDWSERHPHVGGALGAALLTLALKRNWVVQDLDSRALSVTRSGKQQMYERFGVSFQ